MSPTCYTGDCNYWGPSKAYDSKVYGTGTLAHTDWGTNPYLQLNLGTYSGNVTGVRLNARSDCCIDQAANLNIYLSATTSFTGAQSTLCAAGVKFTVVKEVMTVVCPITTYQPKYVTVMHNTSYYVLSIQEVTPLFDGE